MAFIWWLFTIVVAAIQRLFCYRKTLTFRPAAVVCPGVFNRCAFLLGRLGLFAGTIVSLLLLTFRFCLPGCCGLALLARCRKIVSGMEDAGPIREGFRD